MVNSVAAYSVLLLVPCIPLIVKVFERRVLKVELPPTYFLSNDLAIERMANFRFESAGGRRVVLV